MGKSTENEEMKIRKIGKWENVICDGHGKGWKKCVKKVGGNEGIKELRRLSGSERLRDKRKISENEEKKIGEMRE